MQPGFARVRHAQGLWTKFTGNGRATRLVAPLLCHLIAYLGNGGSG